MLSTRLRDLEDRAVVIRQVMPTSPPSVEYSLTPLGRELLPAIQTIAEIGHKLKVQAQMQAAQNAANAAE